MKPRNFSIIAAALLAVASSSQVFAIGHTPTTTEDSAPGILTVQFKPRAGTIQGEVYQYSKVSKETFDAFLAAPSKGKFFGANIQGSQPKDNPLYEYTKLSLEEVSSLITMREAQEISKADVGDVRDVLGNDPTKDHAGDTREVVGNTAEPGGVNAARALESGFVQESNPMQAAHQEEQRQAA